MEREESGWFLHTWGEVKGKGKEEKLCWLLAGKEKEKKKDSA